MVQTVCMDLYHADIRLPEGFEQPTGRVGLEWTLHANRARHNDRYGEIRKFKTVTLDRMQVVEVGVKDGKVAKILVRGRYNDDFDCCMVLIPHEVAPWTVKTVWLNSVDDTHSTLDRRRYVC